MAADGYYDILGVGPDASPQEIRAKYRSLIRRIHPDLDGPVALFRQVQEAYEVLSDPARRAEYDRRRAARGSSAWAADTERSSRSSEGSFNRGGRREASARRGSSSSRSQGPEFRSFPSQNPAGALALGGAVLVVFGAALGDVGRTILVSIGCVGIALGVLAGLGSHSTRKLEAYQRSGMAAIDTMSSREFESFLGDLFVRKGYRVARLGNRGEGRANLLLDHPGGPTVVQVQRRIATVNHEAVQQVAAAMGRFHATRALVVTSSTYSPSAVTFADFSGITLWNRSTLASELAAIQREGRSTGLRKLVSDLRAASHICLGVWATALVVFSSLSWRLRRQRQTRRN